MPALTQTQQQSAVQLQKYLKDLHATHDRLTQTKLTHVGFDAIGHCYLPVQALLVAVSVEVAACVASLATLGITAT